MNTRTQYAHEVDSTPRTKLRVLFISSWYPNKIEPKNGNFVQRHAEAVATQHHVEVLHAIGISGQKKKFEIEDHVVNGIRTLIVYYRQTKFRPTNILRRQKAYQRGFSLLHKPDIVHANILRNNILFADKLRRREKIPYVVSEHFTHYRSINHHRLGWLAINTARYIASHAAKILPVSRELQNGLEALQIRTPMKVIPNVVNTDEFIPSASPRNNQGYRFLHVSSLRAVKNPMEILQTSIRLMEEGHDIHLAIGGDGPLDELIDVRDASKFADRIEVFGAQSESQIAQRMRDSDCFLLFSSDENQPCVLDEAWASGLPAIATNVGGVAEYFPENFGILLPSADTELLAEAMKKMIYQETSVSLRNEMHSYAVDFFSPKSIADHFSAVYSEVLEGII